MNKIAVVTGGSRGIGKAVTVSLINGGFTVYFTYKNSYEQARRLEDDYQGHCYGLQVDSADENQIKKFASEILNKHTPDILINNVGINNDEIFVNQDIDQFMGIINFNFGSTVKYCKQFVPSMMERRSGHIINISSVASIKPKIGNSAYGVSKIAIERFSKSLALELARFNVMVNCVAPGFVKTDLLGRYLEKNDPKTFYSNIPTRKILEVNDVSALVASLCGGLIKTTGSVFYIGNGENIVM